MNETDASHQHIKELRDQARRARADAGRTTDPAERERLQQRVKRLEFDSDQESMMAAGDIYPVE